MNSWELDGFDNKREYLSSKDENWEKSSHAAKWIVSSVIILCVLIFSIKLNVDDILLKIGGNSIETEFRKGITLEGVNEDGDQVTVDYVKNPCVTTKKHLDNGTYQNNKKVYPPNGMTAFTDKNNIIHVIPLMFSMRSLRNDQTITLYYYGDDIGNAKALNATWFWVVLYSVSILLLSICIFVTYRIMHPKSHVSLNVVNKI